MNQLIYLEHLGDLYPDDTDLPKGDDPNQIYWTKMHDDKENRTVIYLAHTGGGGGEYPHHTVRWGSTVAHTVLSLDPPSLVESLGWQDCCGRHGYVKDGTWRALDDSREPTNARG